MEILKTKLYKPRIPQNFVIRRNLIDRLNKINHYPLALVSAPTGYGKSILISSFLEQCDTPFCWISLNEAENNLDFFIRYFIVAIQKIIPEFGNETLSIISSRESAPYDVLRDQIINILEQIDKDTIIVLDDFHLIQNQNVVRLIGEILEHPPLNIHLIIVTRRDPSLAIADMRSKQSIIEIRIGDLKFDCENTKTLFETKFNQSLEDKTIQKVQQQFDGWITGLSLLLINSDTIKGIKQQLDKNLNDTVLFQNLVEQLLDRRSVQIQHCILSASQMNAFCAELLESVCLTKNEPAHREGIGQQVIELLQQSDMFIISLDDHNKWFRFHHLFQDILDAALRKKMEKSTIQQLHEKAAFWFQGENQYWDAIDHFLRADKLSLAIGLFETTRKDLLNNTKWREFEGLFFKFDANLHATHPTLILSNCWYLIVQSKYPELFEFVNKVSNTFEQLVGKREGWQNMMGEWNAIIAYQTILLNSSKNLTLFSDRALSLLDNNNQFPTVYAVILKAMDLRIKGDTGKAIKLYYRHLSPDPNSVINALLLSGLCFNHWMEFDLARLKTIGKKLISMEAADGQYMESYCQGYYFLGIVSYVQNDLNGSKVFLEEAYSNRYKSFASARIFIQVALAYTYFGLGEIHNAHAIIEGLKQNAIKERNEYVLNIANAAEAELYIRNGNGNDVNRWIKNYTLGPITHSHAFYNPRITYIRALITLKDKSQLEKALALLEEWEQFLETVRARNFLIDIHIQKALALHLLDQEEGAILALEKALQLSQNSGAIRNFIDAGPEFARWYNGIHEQLNEYVINRAIHKGLNPELSEDKQMLLSRREQEIIELVSAKYSNKEIGSKLFISEATVKRHITNILRKLDATNRREAVVKALKMDVL